MQEKKMKRINRGRVKFKRTNDRPHGSVSLFLLLSLLLLFLLLLLLLLYGVLGWQRGTKFPALVVSLQQQQQQQQQETTWFIGTVVERSLMERRNDLLRNKNRN